MLVTFAASRMPASGETVPKLAFRAYLAGLIAAAALIVSAPLFASLGLELIFR